MTSEFAVHTNFSKFSSFVLKLRDRISVILFFSETKHLLMRIDPEVIKILVKIDFSITIFCCQFSEHTNT